MAEEIEYPYKPRKPQWEIHKRIGTRQVTGYDIEPKRFCTLTTHRRLGKTVFGVNHPILDSFHIDLDGREHAPPRYGLIYPEKKQGKEDAWDYLKEFASSIPGYSKNESELFVELERTGTKISILGADKPKRIRGSYFDGVFIDEYADIPPHTWTDVVLPALSDFKGWAVLSGTAKGKNHFYKKVKQATESDNWLSVVMPASDELKESMSAPFKDDIDLFCSTDIFTADELDDLRDEMAGDDDHQDPEASFKQEYGCHFNKAVTGAYYAKKLSEARKDDRIRNVPYEAKKPVITAWDLGVGDDMAIWFAQKVNNEIRLIDYYQNSGEGLPFYFDVCRQKEYSYGQHLAPWDIEMRELSSGRSRKEIARDHGFIFQTVSKHKIEDRIEAVRSLLPSCYFDQEKCQQGIQALQEYQKEKDNDDNFKDKPKHNWASNGADAFGYLAMGIDRAARSDQWGDTKQEHTAEADFEVF